MAFYNDKVEKERNVPFGRHCWEKNIRRQIFSDCYFKSNDTPKTNPAFQSFSCTGASLVLVSPNLKVGSADKCILSVNLWSMPKLTNGESSTLLKTEVDDSFFFSVFPLEYL